MMQPVRLTADCSVVTMVTKHSQSMLLLDRVKLGIVFKKSNS